VQNLQIDAEITKRHTTNDYFIS